MNNRQTIFELLNQIGQNEIGPVEIEEKNGIIWNRLDWPSYIKCAFNTELSNLIKIVQEGWCIEPPQIILSILSDFQALNKWQNMEQIKGYQKGLVKAASSARTWIITNGLNVGAARITSEAIVNERNWQHSLINLNESRSANSKHFNSYCSPSNLFEQQLDYARLFDTLDGQETIYKEDRFRVDPFKAEYNYKLANKRNSEQNDFNEHQLINKLHLQNVIQTQYAFNHLPIMKSVIIGVIDSNQIVSGPFFYKRLDDIDQPRLDIDIFSSIKYARQVIFSFNVIVCV